jgi:predicted nucleotidyltransferase
MAESSDGTEIDTAAIRTVVESYPVRLAVLYGSHARGTATAASDVDVAVAFDAALSPDERLRRRVELTADLASALATDDVDVADLDSITPAVGRSVLEDGIVLVDDGCADAYEAQFRAAREDAETHEERMQRFDEVLRRLEATM